MECSLHPVFSSQKMWKYPAQYINGHAVSLDLLIFMLKGLPELQLLLDHWISSKRVKVITAYASRKLLNTASKKKKGRETGLFNVEKREKIGFVSNA